MLSTNQSHLVLVLRGACNHDNVLDVPNVITFCLYPVLTKT
jgi:hypothetical protein